MDSELSNEAGNEFKILEPLIKDAKLLLQKWVLNGEAMALVHIRLRQRSKFHRPPSLVCVDILFNSFFLKISLCNSWFI